MKLIFLCLFLFASNIIKAQTEQANDSLITQQVQSLLNPGNQSANETYFAATALTEKPSNKAFNFYVQTGLYGSSNDQVPFWMRSHQYGSIPLHGISGSLLTGSEKNYHPRNRRSLDWGAGVEARLNAGYKTEVILIQAYAKGRLGPFELKAGRSRDLVGLVDSTLSTGAFSISGNALGIPKVEISFPKYWNVPLTGGLIAVKGSFAHGWVGTYSMKTRPSNPILVDEAISYFHQKTFYGRLGKENWKVKLYGGFNHQVIWGNEDEIYQNWGLSKLKTYGYVVIGKAYEAQGVPKSKVGNHIGSIDQALEWDLGTFDLTAYHQFFYEAGALASLANVEDGLTGVSFKNKKGQKQLFHWNKFLFEFFYSKSQGGEVDSKPRKSPDEDYYNNFLYYNGWSYQEENLGNALITSEKYIRENLPGNDFRYFPNNRLMAFHAASQFQMQHWDITVLLTYSKNFGNYITSPASRGLGDTIVYHDPPYFPEVNQLSGAIQANCPLKHNFELNLQLAFDQGDLLYNSVGGSVSLTKCW